MVYKPIDSGAMSICLWVYFGGLFLRVPNTGKIMDLTEPADAFLSVKIGYSLVNFIANK